MVSFSSSVINKSGKKFAPKAPARRPGPGASTAPAAARPSADRQATAQTAQPTAEAAAPEPTPTTATTTPAPAPEPPSVTEAQEPQPREPEPTPEKPKAAPTAETPIAIPIPAPKRKASISAPSAPVPSPAAAQPAPHPAPPESNVPSAEPPAPEPPVRRDSATAVGEQTRVEAPRDTQAPPVPSPAGDEPTPIRPAKRLKTSEAAAPAERAQASASTLITPPSTQPDVPETGEPARTQNETVPPTAPAAPAATTAQKKTTKSRKRRTAEDGAGEGAAGTPRERKPRARRKREPTPEGAELIEIAPSVVKMSDLCKDLRTGKKSKREMELQNLEMAELERKQKQREERRASTDQVPIKQNGEASPPLDRLPQRKQQAGPKMRIVNGEIVLDTASLQVDRHADAEREAGELEDVVENPLTRKINQATYGKRTKTESWDEEMTDLFYRGLRMFGTDFMMISKMFPGRSRRQIKLKFNNEERKDPERIKDALLGPREHIDIATYSEMTNTVYDDPKVIQQELDEEKKRIEDQHAKEQEAAQELMRNPSAGGGDSAAPEKGNGANGKGRGRNGKKQVLKSMGGGTEEVVGTIDDFPIPA